MTDDTITTQPLGAAAIEAPRPPVPTAAAIAGVRDDAPPKKLRGFALLKSQGRYKVGGNALKRPPKGVSATETPPTKVGASPAQVTPNGPEARDAEIEAARATEPQPSGRALLESRLVVPPAGAVPPVAGAPAMASPSGLTPEQAEASARAVVQAAEGAATTWIGAAWQLTPAERTSLTQPLADIWTANQWPKASPWLGLVAAVVSIVARRRNDGDTRAWWQRLTQRAKPEQLKTYTTQAESSPTAVTPGKPIDPVEPVLAKAEPRVAGASAEAAAAFARLSDEEKFEALNAPRRSMPASEFH